MRSSRSEMALTEELVALVERTEPDPGPPDGMIMPSTEELHRQAEIILADRPMGPLWLFAYGSLIWKPETQYIASRSARIPGWHRRFCMRLTRWRGTRERPGLMMALDRGGSSRGIAYRLPEADAVEQVARLLQRETDANPPTNVARWVSLDTEHGPVAALAFVASPAGANYVGRMPIAHVARTLSTAAGHWGSGAQYLYNTVRHLEAHGIRDRNLWLLQELVAAEIRSVQLRQAA